MYENVVMAWKAGYTHNWSWLMLVKTEESLFFPEIGKEMESLFRIIKKSSKRKALNWRCQGSLKPHSVAHITETGFNQFAVLDLVCEASE